MPDLYVARYQHDGNVKHWALYLEDVVNFEVSGERMGFSYQFPENEGPESTRSHRGNTFVAEIDDVQAFKDIAAEVVIQNDVQGWNCQQWVLDALEKLNNSEIIGDYEYQEAKVKLEALFDQ